MNRTGACRWMGGTPNKEDLREGLALLRITTSKGIENHYWVFDNGKETRLKKMNGSTVYATNLKTGWCDCPDHQQRGTTCKHVKALRAALVQVK